MLARRILQLTEEIHDLQQRLTDTIINHTPTMLTHRGVGPDNAAAVLIAAGDNPDRLRMRHPSPHSAAPVPTSILGQTTRHRLMQGVTAKPTPRSTASPCADCAGTPVPATTSPAASPKAKPVVKPSAA
ncbi:MAG: hypothetical protein M3460_09435 [Actinomycetota bacterium]|nr:hypothetical protein [Actinomycetota bacterium]